ncbi:hypothetical protein WR25_25836 [Diploscapter pachys]|uniref:Lipase domain-containing protein n=1 Tax=Diploscapter pachys TaxID=2018661 RepID=A0A2A2JM02_9BILA|nr:hypothetical protein WR25_25836 [Diploscapter pachys]
MSCQILTEVDKIAANWLNSNGYQSDNFARHDYGTKGSFGGFTDTIKTVNNTPVIFIHGNSDSALHKTLEQSYFGWDNSVEYFLQNGYTIGELYATSWGDTDALNAAKRTHNCALVQSLRRFMQAVLDYTKAPKVSFVTHSMGVTLGRKIIKGGQIQASDGNCDIGPPLNSKVEVFVGLSGANYGLCNCMGTAADFEKTCNKKDGFWPGDSCGMNYMDCGLHPLMFPCTSPTYSSFLSQLNADKTKEGDYVFCAWSNKDDLIEYNDYVWGKPTSEIPTADGKKVYPSYTHMQTKGETAADQFNMVKNKAIPS